MSVTNFHLLGKGNQFLLLWRILAKIICINVYNLFTYLPQSLDFKSKGPFLDKLGFLNAALKKGLDVGQNSQSQKVCLHESTFNIRARNFMLDPA